MNQDLKLKFWSELKRYAPDSVAWNHYDCTIKTGVGEIDEWREFLKEPDVVEWLEEERKIIQKTELTKLTTKVSTSKSVGQAQLVGVMSKVNEANQAENAEGPTFIYTYIPLSTEQKKAPNTRQTSKDIFHIQHKDERIQYLDD